MSQGSDRHAQDAGLQQPLAELYEGDTEEIDAVALPADEALAIASVAVPPVPASRRSAALSSLRSAPVVQAAAVAAGGFVAGAAVVGIARRSRAGTVRAPRHGSGARGRRAKGRRQGAGELLQIVGSRSLLVDVHLLDSAARGRR